MDSGIPIDIIFLDFKKAFDTVPHERLMIKLKAHRVDGNILRWIRSWLKSRRQRVVLNGEFSDWSDVVSGVPQGSVLGPVLFTVFINDIDQGVVNLIKKFADDTKLIGKVKFEHDIESIWIDLRSLEEWSEKWQLKFNGDKCKVMHISLLKINMLNMLLMQKKK